MYIFGALVVSDVGNSKLGPKKFEVTFRQKECCESSKSKLILVMWKHNEATQGGPRPYPKQFLVREEARQCWHFAFWIGWRCKEIGWFNIFSHDSTIQKRRVREVKLSHLLDFVGFFTMKSVGFFSDRSWYKFILYYIYQHFQTAITPRRYLKTKNEGFQGDVNYLQKIAISCDAEVSLGFTLILIHVHPF